MLHKRLYVESERVILSQAEISVGMRYLCQLCNSYCPSPFWSMISRTDFEQDLSGATSWFSLLAEDLRRSTGINGVVLYYSFGSARVEVFVTRQYEVKKAGTDTWQYEERPFRDGIELSLLGELVNKADETGVDEIVGLADGVLCYSYLGLMVQQLCHKASERPPCKQGETLYISMGTGEWVMLLGAFSSGGWCPRNPKTRPSEFQLL